MSYKLDDIEAQNGVDLLFWTLKVFNRQTYDRQGGSVKSAIVTRSFTRKFKVGN